MADEPLVSVLLPGPPMGKKRHRSRVVIPRVGKPWVQQYPDPDGVAYEADLAAVGREAMQEVDLMLAPYTCALTCFVEAFVAIPASWSKKDHAAAVAGDIVPTSKPDGDNYAKTAGDALNKIVWLDDSQIIMWQVLKLYSDFPRLRVSVWKWNDVPVAEPELI